jgi:hypothetical protein
MSIIATDPGHHVAFAARIKRHRASAAAAVAMHSVITGS